MKDEVKQVIAAIPAYMAERTPFLAPNTLKSMSVALQLFARFSADEKVISKDLIVRLTAFSLNEGLVYGWKIIRAGRRESTVSKYRVNMATFFKWCIERKLMSENFAECEGLPRLSNKAKPRKVFTEETYLLIRNRCKKTVCHEILVTAWHTGLRGSDCVSLRWSHINFDTESITITPQKTKRYGIEVTIPIHSELMQILRSAKSNQPDPTFVFPHHRIHFLSIRTRFGVYCNSIGLFSHGFHSLRHGFITRYSEKGLNNRQLKRLVGLSSAQLETYDHPSNEGIRKAMFSR